MHIFLQSHNLRKAFTPRKQIAKMYIQEKIRVATRAYHLNLQNPAVVQKHLLKIRKIKLRRTGALFLVPLRRWEMETYFRHLQDQWKFLTTMTTSVIIILRTALNNAQSPKDHNIFPEHLPVCAYRASMTIHNVMRSMCLSWQAACCQLITIP